MLLHPGRNTQVLNAMVPTDTTWSTVLGNGIGEEAEHSVCAVVVVDSDADHKPGMAINETVGDHFKLD